MSMHVPVRACMHKRTHTHIIHTCTYTHTHPVIINLVSAMSIVLLNQSQFSATFHLDVIKMSVHCSILVYSYLHSLKLEETLNWQNPENNYNNSFICHVYCTMSLGEGA